MDINNPLIILIFSMVALTTVSITHKLSPISLDDSGRNITIDGLRGFLALFVFIHHSNIWYAFLHNNVWKLPDNAVFANIGKTSVAMFFMITGYLFYGKIRKSKEINWNQLYISRFFRLYPLYFLIICVMLVIAGIQTNWTPVTYFSNLMVPVYKWFSLSAYGSPNINGLRDTLSIVSGVTWTLVYEVFFYLSLPLVCVITGKKTPVIYILISLSAMIAFYLHPLNKIYIIFFVIGFIASYLKDIKLLMSFADTKACSILISIIYIILISNFHGIYEWQSMLLCGVIFILICSGCDIFGILKIKSARLLGEATYSIYLLHGPLIYITFRMMLDNSIKNFSIVEYTMICTLICVVLVSLSYLTFKYIESPMINFGKSVRFQKTIVEK
ncbi:acyltransferase family protein [Citrobacter sp. NCU1]|uniref:acyltransferase family protein n=1 Tax=Citrobacter sp. NCU1 TaxID=2026683 RepID=UPI001390B4AF|nr:acyltransferase [Citrobacter sp. NCU1]